MIGLPPQRRRRRHGFTLVETIATMAVLGVLGSIVSAILLTSTDGYLSAVTASQLHVETSTAMDRIARDLRNIPLNAAEDGPRVASVTSQSITFGSGSAVERVGDQLLLTENGQQRVLLEHVTQFQIEAFDDEAILLPSVLDGQASRNIRTLRLTITVSRHGVSHTLRTAVFIRSTIGLS